MPTVILELQYCDILHTMRDASWKPKFNKNTYPSQFSDPFRAPDRFGNNAVTLHVVFGSHPPPPPPFTLAPYTNYRPFRPFLFNLAELLKGRITLFTRYITIQWTSSVDVVAAPVVVVVVAVFFFPYRFPQIFSAFLSYHKCNVTSLTDLISVYVTVLTYLKFVDHSTNQKIQRCKKHQYSKTKINRPPHRAM